MYGKCTECKATRIETNSYDRNGETWWWTWRTKEEERNIKKKDERETIKVKMTCKEKSITSTSITNTKHIDVFEKTLGMIKQ